MKRKSVWLIVTIFMVISLIMTSCGSAEEEGSGSSVTVTQGDVTVDTQEGSATTDSGGSGDSAAADTEEKRTILTPQYGGRITYIDHGAGIPSTWDPNADNFGTAGFLGGCLYERLLAINYSKGRTGTDEYEFIVRWKPEEAYVDGAGLAESWEFRTPTELVVNIRQNVYWPAKPEIGLSEKRLLVADDIVYVYKSALEHARTSEILKKLVKDVSTMDEHTVLFELNYYHRDWPNDLSTQFRLIACPESYEAGIEDWRNFNGTGAFRVENVVEGVGVFATRNEDYWQTNYTMPDGKQYQLPFADEIVIVAIPDEASRIAALRTGQIDAAFRIGWQYKDSLESTNPELNRWDTHYNGSYLIGMREDNPLFENKEVRRALSMALDRNVINAAIFGGSPILDFPFHPTWNEAWGIDVYTPLEDYSAEFQEGFSYNPERAKELLAAAGYPDGFQATIEYSTNILNEDLLSLVADYWSDINVDLTLKPLAGAEANSRMRGHLYSDMYLADDSSVSPVEAFDCHNSWGLKNLSMVRDDYLDEQVIALGALTPGPESDAKWKALCIYANERFDYIVLPRAKEYCYAWPWIKNFEGETWLSYLSMSPAWMYAWVDQDMKSSMGFTTN